MPPSNPHQYTQGRRARSSDSAPLALGVDVGSRVIKIVALKRGPTPTRHDPSLLFVGKTQLHAAASLSEAVQGFGKEDLVALRETPVGVTGCRAGEIPLETGRFREIFCAAREVNHRFPGAQLLLSLGAERSFAVRLERQGEVEDYGINEKCAGGGGSFLEAVAQTLEAGNREDGDGEDGDGEDGDGEDGDGEDGDGAPSRPGAPQAIETLSRWSLTSNHPVPLSTQCVVFAESEVISRVHQGHRPADIAAGVFLTLAQKGLGLLERLSLSRADRVVVFGGVATLEGTWRAMERLFVQRGLKPPVRPADPLGLLARGAALQARETPRQATTLKALSQALQGLPQGQRGQRGQRRQKPHVSETAPAVQAPPSPLRPSSIKVHPLRDPAEEKVFAGVDIGSTSSQAVVLQGRRLVSYATLRTGRHSPTTGKQVLDRALREAGISRGELSQVVGTGYGRTQVPGVGRTVSEISCHAAAAPVLFGGPVATLLDMGGQDCKAIRLDPQGRVLEFFMNERCAAGTGRGLEVLAEILGLSLDELFQRPLRSPSSSKSSSHLTVSSTCVVFARREALASLRQGRSVGLAVNAYCHATVQRVSRLLARVGVEPPLAVSGGIAKNPTMMHLLEERLDLTPLAPKWDPQIAGALGAALHAQKKRRRKKKSPG